MCKVKKRVVKLLVTWCCILERLHAWKKSELTYNKLLYLITFHFYGMIVFMLYISFEFVFKIFTITIFCNKKGNLHVEKLTSVTFWFRINITIKWFERCFSKKLGGKLYPRPTVLPFLHLLSPSGSRVPVVPSRHTCSSEHTISWTAKGHFHVRYLLANVKFFLLIISHSPPPILQDKKASGENFSWI